MLLPSDDHRKVAGILCEYRPPADGADELIVIGVGLNVSQTRDQLPVDTGTSLTLAGAEPVDREDLLVTVLDRIAVRYAALQAGGAAADGVRAAYRAACSTLGTEVRLERPGAGTSTAHALDIDADGAPRRRGFRTDVVCRGRRDARAARLRGRRVGMMLL